MMTLPRLSGRLFTFCPFAWLALSLASLAGGAVQAEPVTPLSVPRFTHPGSGQVCYFLLTDRFANGSPANDSGGLADRAEISGFDPTRISHYHGGDFKGLTAKLDYIKKLGVTAVWVTPPFRNKPMQLGTAGYHGYWILDFLHIDPHLGTDAEFHEFVRQAHARGLKVYLDIIVNHTADVIQYKNGITSYVPKSAAPYRNTKGQPFDEQAVAFNGLSQAGAFPKLSNERSFAYVPVVPSSETNAKNPAWLNRSIYYHNRGNSTFVGENALHGDFVGLDDVFTEHPDVVRGFIEIYRHWLEEFKVDGFRIDTAKHVNVEFWQAFAPAIREYARQAGKPGFIQFGEVMDESMNVAFLSEFSNTALLDTSLDFGFMKAAIAFVSKESPASAMGDLLALDDYYTGPANNVHTTTTFLGNHDLGRFGFFLQRDNPKATPAQLTDLAKLGHGLLFLSRGQPVIYYGDEQGMIGRGGNDMQAREDMFAAQAADFRSATLLGTTRTGADDKFDEQHPFYQTFHALAALRIAHPALSRGATLVRPATNASLLAFSRIERNERVEYLAAFNNSRTAVATASLATSQPAGATLRRLYDSQAGADKSPDVLTTDARGQVTVSLAALQFAVWRAESPLAASASTLTIALPTPADRAELQFPLREKDGHAFPVRQEIRADVTGGDGVAEVTFTLSRASRPGQSELLGTDDAPPYRVFWRPPPDFVPGDELTFTATVDDLRGHRAVARTGKIKIAAGTPVFGQKGAVVPVLRATPPANITVAAGAALTVTARAEGSGTLEYQWLRDGVEIPGATSPTYSVAEVSAAHAGEYRVLVHNPAGTTIGPATVVTVSGAGRIEKHAAFPSRFVAPREIEVWLPPGYEADSHDRYPVIYMHDGQNIFDPTRAFGGSSWEVDRALGRLIRQGKVRPAIIVGIWNDGLGRYPEYMPKKAVAGDRVFLNHEVPPISAAAIRSDNYLQFLVAELKPFIDRTYRTEPDAPHTFVMGSSMGGLISAYAIAEHPEIFGGAACVSTHWIAGEGAVVDYLARHLPTPRSHRIYFDYGTATLDAEYEPFRIKMDAAMQAAGYVDGQNWITRKFPGADHSEKSWRERVEIPLTFLLGS